jgi:hypothetical protein
MHRYDLKRELEAQARANLATRSRDALPLEDRLIAAAILYLKTKTWSRNKMAQLQNRKY